MNMNIGMKIRKHWIKFVGILVICFGVMGFNITPDIIVKGAPWYDVRGYSSLSSALTAIGASNKTLLVVGNVSVSSDVEIGSNVHVWFLGGGKFTVASGKTLTLLGPITAGNHLIFVGPGTVVPPKQALAVEWFGGLDEVVSILGATKAEVEISSDLVVANNISLLDSINLRIRGGGTITINAGKELVIDGYFSAPNNQVFYGDGAVSLSARQPLQANWWPSFAKALDDIDTDVRVLEISSTQGISGNVEVPSNVILKFTSGGMLDVSGGVSVAIAGPVEAGSYQIFDGAGSVTFSNGAKIRSSWFNNLTQALGTLSGIKAKCIIDKAESLSGAILLDENTCIESEKNSVISLVMGSLTLGCYSAGPYQTFSGNGVQFARADAANPVYPEWWGAVGDGTTDNTTYMAQALASIPEGGRILFSGGVYLTNGMVVVYDKTHIEIANAATIRSTGVVPEPYALIYTGMSDTLINGGGTLDGNSTATDLRMNGVRIMCDTQSTYNNRVENIRIKNITANRPEGGGVSGGDGVYVGGSGSNYNYGVRLSNLHIQTVGRNGISIINASGAIIADNFIQDWHQTGIDFEPSSEQRANNCTVSGNSIISGDTYSNLYCFDVRGAGSVWTGNSCVGATSHAVKFVSNTEGIQFVGNYIDGGLVGLLLQGTDGNSKYNNISNNIIKNSSNSCVRWAGAQQIAMSNNTLIDCGYTFMDLNNHEGYNSVHNNVFINTGVTSRYAISAESVSGYNVFGPQTYIGTFTGRIIKHSATDTVIDNPTHLSFTSNSSIDAGFSGSSVTNAGATGTITLTLPRPALYGFNLLVGQQTSYDIRLDPADDERIDFAAADGTRTICGAGKYLTIGGTTAIGELRYRRPGLWIWHSISTCNSCACQP